MKIGVDLDGVCYPFVQQYRYFKQNETGKAYPEVETWKFYEEWGISLDEFLEDLRECSKAIFSHGTPPRLAATTLRSLLHHGHEIVYCTHRPKEAEDVTRAWLDKWGFPRLDKWGFPVADGVIFTPDKNAHGFDLIVDDCTDILVSAQKAGIEAVAFDQPWNQDWTGPRVHTWGAFRNYVLTPKEELLQKLFDHTPASELAGENRTPEDVFAFDAKTNFFLGKPLTETQKDGFAEVRVTDPETGGQKGRKPQRFELLPEDTLGWVAEHYHEGAEKYDDRNWERGYAWSLSYGAMRRHMAAFWQGEDIDPDSPSGKHHMQAVVFHALALATFVNRGIGTDDRPALILGAAQVGEGFPRSGD